MDTIATPVSLAEFARATEDFPFGESNDKGNGAAASLVTRAGSGMADVPVGPTAEDIATLTTQYKKAVNGLYEAYLFGQMLLAVKARLEGRALSAKTQLLGAPGYAAGTPAPGTAGHFTGSLTRETAMEQFQNGRGWNAGTGLKAWLAEHCLEINYKTALRFLAVAEKTNAALAESEAVPASPRPALSAGEGLGRGAPETFPEETIRAYLEGKSQRQLLGRGGAREEAGRPRKHWAEALGTSPEAAMKRLEEALGPLNELVVVKQTHRLLAAADLETLRAAIDLLHERVHAEV